MKHIMEIEEIEPQVRKNKNGLKYFLTFPVGFLIPIIFSHLNHNCSNLLDLRKPPGASQKSF